VTRNLVEKHGGAVHIHSRTTPGKSYTAFSIFLPMIPIDTSRHTAQATQLRAG